MFILRLDDAAPNMEINNWMKLEKILDKYNIKPIVGVIPDNKDPEIIEKYDFVQDFWGIVRKWQNKNWNIAIHGYQHLYLTNQSGLNPVNKRSEFAGLTLDEQINKVICAEKIFKQKKIDARVFFAPSHTFDINTIRAIREFTSIEIISDTIAFEPYIYQEIKFLPQQYSHVRSSIFPFTTFCYHPNTMTDSDFIKLEDFLKKNSKNHINDISILKFQKKLKIRDRIIRYTYFFYRKMRRVVNRWKK